MRVRHHQWRFGESRTRDLPQVQGAAFLMARIGGGTEYRGVCISQPARSTLLTISIGDQKVALNKTQALRLADYLSEEAGYLDEN